MLLSAALYSCMLPMLHIGIANDKAGFAVARKASKGTSTGRSSEVTPRGGILPRMDRRGAQVRGPQRDVYLNATGTAVQSCKLRTAVRCARLPATVPGGSRRAAPSVRPSSRSQSVESAVSQLSRVTRVSVYTQMSARI